MKLSRKAITHMTVKLQNRLATELERSGYTIGRWIRDNEANGPLTKQMALDIIAEESGLNKNEILVSEVKETQN
jgi:hypothetical protein